MKRRICSERFSAEDLASLRSSAVERREACCCVAKGPRLRINLAVKDGVVGMEYTIEVLLRLVASGESIDLGRLEADMVDARDLVSRGYELGHQDEMWLCCERQLPENSVLKELSELIVLLEASK